MLPSRPQFHRNLDDWRGCSWARSSAFHSQHGAHHREQRELHAAELEKVEKSLDAFRAASARAVELSRPVEPPTPAAPRIELPPRNRLMASRLVWQLVSGPDLAEPFSPSTVAGEVNRRFGSHLPKPLTVRATSDALRRLAAEGKIHLVSEGRPFHEALYTRRPPRARA